MYEQVFRNVLFPLYEAVARRRQTHRHLADYERSQWLDRAALEALQLEKLNALLAHCWANVPFLARYWREAGARPGALRHVSELQQYPVISKRTITENFAAMRARGFTGTVLSKATGGSTGDPFRFEYSEESYARRTAVMWRGYRWCGADLGRRAAYVWGAGAPAPGWRGSKDRAYHAAFNRKYFNCFELTEANVDRYIAALDDYRPRVIVGYVGPLVLLGRRILERNISIHRPESVISAAEALTAPHRELLARAFGAPVFNTYGCREFMLIACECQQRRGLHVSADHLVVETLGPDGASRAGVSGDVCITDLHNYAMPFVRYLNGDCATLSERRCDCGRGLPLLDSVEGRILDVIVTPDGRTMPGEFFVHVMLDFPHVVHYQVVQESRDQVEIRIVPRERLTAEDRDRLLRRVVQGIGTTIEVRVVEVPEIPLTPSGKRRVTVSKIAREASRASSA